MNKTGGTLYREGLLTDAALEEAVTSYLARPSAPMVIAVGDERLDVAAAVSALPWSMEILAMDGVSARQRRNAVVTAILTARSSRG
jgi:hypothetical protein